MRARARLRFGPGRTCEPLARLLDQVIVQAEHAGLRPERLILASGSIQAAEDIVRVRRKAHGTADWIASPTSRVLITLRPGLRLDAAAQTGRAARVAAGGDGRATARGTEAPAPEPAGRDARPADGGPAGGRSRPPSARRCSK